VRAKENDGPEQGTCCQVEAHLEAEDVQLGGGKSDARLGRENFYAHHLSQQRVGNENTGQDNEKSSSLLFSGGGHGGLAIIPGSHRSLLRWPTRFPGIRCVLLAEADRGPYTGRRSARATSALRRRLSLCPRRHARCSGASHGLLLLRRP